MTTSSTLTNLSGLAFHAVVRSSRPATSRSAVARLMGLAKLAMASALPRVVVTHQASPAYPFMQLTPDRGLVSAVACRILSVHKRR